MANLGLDIGSSGIKAAVVRDGRIIGRIARIPFPTRFDGVRAEVHVPDLFIALARAIGELGQSAENVDAVGLSVMSPAWVAMDARGKAITPLITHQDRRSITVAIDFEKRAGKSRLMRITGNRPYPGSITSTNIVWFERHHPGLIRRADLIGHLNTLIIRRLTGARVIDPSNASFTGLYETVRQGGWSAELCDRVNVRMSQLPEILESGQIAGRVSKESARRFGLTAGTPVAAGAVDTSCAMFLNGLRIGRLMNTCGSTDVLALCTSKAHPNERLLTRAAGIGKKWISAATLAASGSAIRWCKTQLFPEMSDQPFYKLLHFRGRRQLDSPVQFAPYLAGERASIEQKTASFTGLSLSTTREDMLRAVLNALARASAERIELLRSLKVPMLRKVVTSGGGAKSGMGILLVIKFHVGSGVREPVSGRMPVPASRVAKWPYCLLPRGTVCGVPRK